MRTGATLLTLACLCLPTLATATGPSALLIDVAPKLVIAADGSTHTLNVTLRAPGVEDLTVDLSALVNATWSPTFASPTVRVAAGGSAATTLTLTFPASDTGSLGVHYVRGHARETDQTAWGPFVVRAT